MMIGILLALQLTCYPVDQELNTDNFHENWSLTGIKKTKFNKTQKKFKGKLPTLKQLESI